MKLATFILVGVALVAMTWYAPKYLSYADKPVKSDVIVLFVGPDFNARNKEALKLIEEGYAQKLLIPGNVINLNVLTHPRVNASSHYPRYFENTHQEMLEAKKAIDKTGFRSAIFVSSPFHMRRIKIIADNIFDSRFLQMKFVPTRYESGTDPVWFLSMHDLKMVAAEYLKIAWFAAYRHFAAQGILEQRISISNAQTVLKLSAASCGDSSILKERNVCINLIQSLRGAQATWQFY